MSADGASGGESLVLVQLFLPLYGNDKQAFPKRLFDEVRAQLLERFGGATTYVRSPAVGVWEDEDGDVCRDDVVLFEVMADTLDHGWWRTFRRDLERRFEQDEVMIRATRVERL